MGRSTLVLLGPVRAKLRHPIDKPQPLWYSGCGRIAQLAEQLTLNQRVRGSSPRAPTIKYNDLASERLSYFLIQ